MKLVELLVMVLQAFQIFSLENDCVDCFKPHVKEGFTV